MESLVQQVQSTGQNQSSSMQTKSAYASKQSPTMCEYLRDHIMEELEGAKDYMSKALELKEKYPAWAHKFYKMAEMETEHANCMNKIFASMGNSDETCHDSMYKEILEAYTKYMTDISTMKTMYFS